MVYIITGEINSGKTTRLLSIYNEKQEGDGFVTLKVYSHGKYIGQKIRRLSTGEETYLSMVRDIPKDWDEKCRYDDYSFSQSGINLAQKTADDIIKRGINPAFVDEIGPLELQGKGFFDVFSLLLSECRDIYFTVRITSLNDVIEKFIIKDCVIQGITGQRSCD